MSEKHKIGIIGSGGVGLTCLGYLADAADVIIKTRRPEQARALTDQGVFVTTPDGTLHASEFTATADVADLADCDGVIITVKSYDTETVANELASVIRPDCEVVTLQNGLQAHDVLKKSMPNPERVFAGLTYVFAKRDDDTHITLGANVKTVVDADATKISRTLTNSRFDFIASHNIRQEVWEKMVLNVGQNALGAITGLNLNDMGLSDECLFIGSKLLEEFAHVAYAEGIIFEGSLLDKLKANWEGSRHHPSMWQDLDAGKRTEIDAINGAIVELGKKHSIETPYNEMISSLVRAVE